MNPPHIDLDELTRVRTRKRSARSVESSRKRSRSRNGRANDDADMQTPRSPRDQWAQREKSTLAHLGKQLTLLVQFCITSINAYVFVQVENESSQIYPLLSSQLDRFQRD